MAEILPFLCCAVVIFIYEKSAPSEKNMIFYFEIRISKQKFQARIILMVFLKPEIQGFLDNAKILEFWFFLLKFFLEKVGGRKINLRALMG